MKNLAKFIDFKLSSTELKAVTGGNWCYSYNCTCGGTSYNGWGRLSDYQADAQANCQPGYGVECQFLELSPSTCGY